MNLMDFSFSPPELSEAAKVSQTRTDGPSVGSVAIKDVLGVKDEAAMKKQKRKEANRLSAQRSRSRKQAELDELKRKVETLGSENQNLRNVLQMMSEKNKNLGSENNYFRELFLMRSNTQKTPSIEPKVDDDDKTKTPSITLKVDDGYTPKTPSITPKVNGNNAAFHDFFG